jgi:hypothetical protein
MAMNEHYSVHTADNQNCPTNLVEVLYTEFQNYRSNELDADTSMSVE